MATKGKCLNMYRRLEVLLVCEVRKSKIGTKQ
jgi:hypothetical protein